MNLTWYVASDGGHARVHQELEGLRAKVSTVLSRHLTVSTDLAGDVAVVVDSSKTTIACWETDDERCMVTIESTVLAGVAPSPELFEYVALHSNDRIYGHLACEQDGTTVRLLFTHTLLGRFLDDDELLQAVYGVAGTSEEIDDHLQQQFGGLRHVDLGHGPDDRERPGD